LWRACRPNTNISASQVPTGSLLTDKAFGLPIESGTDLAFLQKKEFQPALIKSFGTELLIRENPAGHVSG
jgi:hypothetical protein